MRVSWINISTITFGIVMLFCIPFSAFAAISIDTSIAVSIGSGNSQTVAFTTSGTNRYLVVAGIIQGSFSWTGCTYAGVSMTQLATVNATNVSGGETDYMYGLANPASGSNNIVCNFSGSATNGIGAVDYNGAQQTTAVEASNTGTGSSGTASVSVTTLTNNDWLIGYARGQSNVSASTNTTLRSCSSNNCSMDSNAAQSLAGSHSLNFTTSGNNNWAEMVVALKPVSAPKSSFNFWHFF